MSDLLTRQEYAAIATSLELPRDSSISPEVSVRFRPKMH